MKRYRLPSPAALLLVIALAAPSSAGAASSALSGYQETVAADAPLAYYSLDSVDSASLGPGPSPPPPLPGSDAANTPAPIGYLCAGFAPIKPVAGSDDGGFCSTSGTTDGVISEGPFEGSRAIKIGPSRLEIPGPREDQWSGEFSLEYWTRWQGAFGGAANIRFGSTDYISTGFACEGTGAITSLETLPSSTVSPPACLGEQLKFFRTLATSVGLSHSEWHHIVLVRSRNEMQMWVDAARINDGSVVRRPPAPWRIVIGGGPFLVAGSTLIAEPAFYVKALEESQILSHYRAGRSGRDTLCGIGNNDLFIGEANDDNLSGGAGSDRLEGDEGADTFDGGLGNDRIEAGPGNDRTGEISRSDCKGESLAGADRIDAGPGNDVMQGGAGNDTMIGGRGKDTLDAGVGNDRVEAADRQRDIVNCGAGRDSVKADRVDKLIGCEKISR